MRELRIQRAGLVGSFKQAINHQFLTLARATAGGLVFVSGTLDKLIRAFDSETGKELWSYELPYIGSAPSTSYKVNGEQYIVIPASGGIILKMYYKDLVEQGDAIVAFKIKD